MGLVDYERKPPAGAEPTRHFHIERFRDLLQSLGSPQESFPAVHVAGTKGKGWVCSALASICQHAELRTGLYTSPHLRSFRERIRVDGEPISAEDYSRGISDLGPRFHPLESESGFRTVFEILTALAFRTFQREKVDIAIIETGLGGRLDCTNVIMPVLSVITSMGWDHMSILGKTMTAITREKAGIIKPGIPVVAAPQTADVCDEVVAELSRVAEAQSAPLIHAHERIDVQQLHESIAGSRYRATLQGRPLEIAWEKFGPAAEINMAVILAAVEQLRIRNFDLTDEAVRQGLENWHWPGRLQVVSQRPVVIIDGAHNANSAVALRQALDRVMPAKAIHWVLGMLRDKDIETVIRVLVREQDHLITAPAPSPRGASSTELAQAARKVSADVQGCDSIREALELAAQQAGSEGVICVAGSLYLVGPAEDEARKVFNTK